MYIEYSIPSDDYIGSILGHINLTLESIEFHNYFVHNQRLNDENLNLLKEHLKGQKFSILMNMEVDENFRGEGYGKELIDTFINKSNEIIVLIADIQDSFFIESWYESLGFQTIASHLGFPIMIKF